MKKLEQNNKSITDVTFGFCQLCWPSWSANKNRSVYTLLNRRPTADRYKGCGGRVRTGVCERYTSIVAYCDFSQRTDHCSLFTYCNVLLFVDLLSVAELTWARTVHNHGPIIYYSMFKVPTYATKSWVKGQRQLSYHIFTHTTTICLCLLLPLVLVSSILFAINCGLNVSNFLSVKMDMSIIQHLPQRCRCKEIMTEFHVNDACNKITCRRRPT